MCPFHVCYIVGKVVYVVGTLGCGCLGGWDAYVCMCMYICIYLGDGVLCVFPAGG